MDLNDHSPVGSPLTDRIDRGRVWQPSRRRRSIGEVTRASTVATAT